ncbi:hypothetical protein GCM10009725_02480 [Aeromicrobium tamlense]|uniref:Uncharacterized protein n=1 Tax=Aeromicrobium tamlense TaxID=375541 RepID=A0ABX2SGK9_9ACTN|nr:hypothetical protein [Aeromicrobium tamlense]
MLVDLRAELHLLDDRVRLVASRLARLLGGFVLELSEVHEAADRGPGLRGDLDEIEIGLGGQAQGILDADDADLFTARSDETDLRYANALVDAQICADGSS